MSLLDAYEGRAGLTGATRPHYRKGSTFGSNAFKEGAADEQG